MNASKTERNRGKGRGHGDKKGLRGGIAGGGKFKWSRKLKGDQLEDQKRTKVSEMVPERYQTGRINYGGQTLMRPAAS